MLRWSVTQLGYSIMAWATPLPTASDNFVLVFPEHEPGYTSLVFPCIAVVVFGIRTFISARLL